MVKKNACHIILWAFYDKHFSREKLNRKEIIRNLLKENFNEYENFFEDCEQFFFVKNLNCFFFVEKCFSHSFHILKLYDTHFSTEKKLLKLYINTILAKNIWVKFSLVNLEVDAGYQKSDS